MEEERRGRVGMRQLRAVDERRGAHEAMEQLWVLIQQLQLEDTEDRCR